MFRKNSNKKMAYSITIADRIRKALSHTTDVKEKKMFGGLAFMVKRKNVPHGWS